MGYLVFIFWAGIGLLIYTYFIYPVILIFSTKFISQRLSDVSESNVLPKVSFVIAAYNEEKVIASKIKNCLRLEYPEELLDIWVASDGSSDKTNDIVKSFTEGDKRIHLLEFPRTGKSGVINKTMALVKNEVVVFSDANTEYAADAVRNLVRHFRDPRVGCVCGRLIYRNPGEVVSGKGESFYWRYETALKKMESKLGYVAGANGAIYAVRKELFKPLPPRTINDDFTISMRIVEKGYRCIYEENAIAYEDVSPTVKGEFRRHIRDGAGHYLAMRYLIKLLNPFLGIRAFIYWSHRVVRWIAPFIMIFLVIINLLLINHFFYKITCLLQAGFYLLAIAGFINIESKRMPFFIYVPFYFCNLNLALLLGFFKVLTGKQKITWESTDRVSNF